MKRWLLILLLASLASAAEAQTVFVSGGYGTAATSVTLTSGSGSQLPASPFVADWWDYTTYFSPFSDPNWERVNVTGKSGDVLTVVRGFNGTSPQNHNTVGHQYAIAVGVLFTPTPTLTPTPTFTPTPSFTWTATPTFVYPIKTVGVVPVSVVGGAATISGGSVSVTNIPTVYISEPFGTQVPTATPNPTQPAYTSDGALYVALATPTNTGTFTPTSTNTPTGSPTYTPTWTPTPLQVNVTTNPVPVSYGSGIFKDNLIQVGGTNINAGQSAMANSVPVAIASNQSPVTTVANQGTTPYSVVATVPPYFTFVPTPPLNFTSDGALYVAQATGTPTPTNTPTPTFTSTGSPTPTSTPSPTPIWVQISTPVPQFTFPPYEYPVATAAPVVATVPPYFTPVPQFTQPPYEYPVATAAPVVATVPPYFTPVPQFTFPPTPVNYPVTFLTSSSTTAAWTSSTANNTAVTLNCTGYGSVLVSLNSGVTGVGTVAFSASDDGGSTFYTVQLNNIPTSNSAAPNGYVSYSLNAGNQVWMMNVGAFTHFRLLLSPAITGTGTANLRATAFGGPSAMAFTNTNVTNIPSISVNSLPSVSFSAGQTVSIGTTGEVKADQGTGNALSGFWPFAATDGTNKMAVTTTSTGGANVSGAVVRPYMPSDGTNTEPVGDQGNRAKFVTVGGIQPVVDANDQYLATVVPTPIYWYGQLATPAVGVNNKTVTIDTGHVAFAATPGVAEYALETPSTGLNNKAVTMNTGAVAYAATPQVIGYVTDTSAQIAPAASTSTTVTTDGVPYLSFAVTNASGSVSVLGLIASSTTNLLQLYNSQGASQVNPLTANGFYEATCGGYTKVIFSTTSGATAVTINYDFTRIVPANVTQYNIPTNPSGTPVVIANSLGPLHYIAGTDGTSIRPLYEIQPNQDNQNFGASTFGAVVDATMQFFNPGSALWDRGYEAGNTSPTLISGYPAGTLAAAPPVYTQGPVTFAATGTGTAVNVVPAASLWTIQVDPFNSTTSAVTLQGSMDNSNYFNVVGVSISGSSAASSATAANQGWPWMRVNVNSLSASTSIKVYIQGARQ